MPTVNSGEPDPDRARQVAEGGCILRCLVGSTVHGLANAGTDDRDEMGVCIEPPEYVLGLRPFDHFVYRTQPEGMPSGPGDLDLTIYGLRKWARLALKGSPTVLLLLFAPEEATMVRTELGAELQDLAPAFVSRRTAQAFLGYLDAQRRALAAPPAPGRARELSATHGYDTKYAMHALRIGMQGEELLRTGRISLPVPEPGRGWLMQVRRGEVAIEAVLAELGAQVARLEALSAAPGLRERADAERVDRFLSRAYRTAWAA